MAAKFDSEDLVAMLRSVMETGGALNAKIAAIEAEKTAASKGLTPTLVAVAAYHEQTWDDSILQKSPCVFYGIEDVATSNQGHAVAKTYQLFAEIVYVDSAQYQDGWKRISRYSRALEELFNEAFADAVGVTVTVKEIRPMSFKTELNSSDEVKVGGISLSVTLV
jgi:hypothetical protein